MIYVFEITSPGGKLEYRGGKLPRGMRRQMVHKRKHPACESRLYQSNLWNSWNPEERSAISSRNNCPSERCRVANAPRHKNPYNPPRYQESSSLNDPRTVVEAITPRGRRGLALAPLSLSSSVLISPRLLSLEISSLSGDCLHHHHFRYRCLGGTPSTRRGVGVSHLPTVFERAIPYAQ